MVCVRTIMKQNGSQVMDYDVVIATRNRPRALEMSLPLIATQSIKPRTIIIVDASDDYTVTQAVVQKTLSHTGIETVVLVSKDVNAALQRNMGLQQVVAPIVMMPDDDSLWYPNTAEETLAIYALDHEHRVGAVTGRPTLASPLDRIQESYGRSRSSWLKQRIQPLRSKVEDRLFPQPFKTYARELWPSRIIPEWVDDRRSALVETLAGFRMSFRSDIAKAAGFDELLGYKTGYANYEDMDITLRLQKEGKLLVSAERALVYHHVFPGGRGGGFQYGFRQIANYIYICAKVMARSSLAWSQLERYTWYKAQIYRLNRDPYGRDVYAGARAAWAHRRLLMEAKPESLADTFRSLCSSIHASRSTP